MTDVMEELKQHVFHEWDEKQQALLRAVLDAHAASAARNSISTNVCLNVGLGSGDYCKAIAAAILSIGDAHAPVGQVMELLAFKDLDDLERMAPKGKTVMGWGNSFIKGPDPIWDDVRDLIESGWPDMDNRMGCIGELLHGRSIFIYPNPACYTAACAIILNIPKEVAAWIFIEGRLRAWTDAFLYQKNHGA